MARYVVTVPYIVPKVRDPISGGFMHRGYYQHAVIEGDEFDPENLKHHLEGEMVALVEEPPPEEPAKPAKAAKATA